MWKKKSELLKEAAVLFEYFLYSSVSQSEKEMTFGLKEFKNFCCLTSKNK